MESGTDVLAIPGRLGCLVNWQDAKLIPASEPRKLLASVRLRSKHGSNGIPCITAKTDSPEPAGFRAEASRSASARCPQANCTLDRTIGMDAALSGRPFKAGEREQVLDD